jgi:hypothetical protein
MRSRSTTTTRCRSLSAARVTATSRRMPPLRNGWVDRVGEDETPKGGFLPPLVITAAGYRALADALERDRRNA